ncbi:MULTISPECIES: hypothetical protein [Cupriavidus]|uniref:hypothetical protein n=1 Tax=Cupriavidus TaxID=106589 RepID=UPI00039DD3A9|nr:MULTISPECIES: hypothetical protein [Cupriavidus]
MTQDPPSPPAAPALRILFAFGADAGTVLEIKRLGLPAGTPRARLYQWLWLDGAHSPPRAQPLRFVSMAEEPGAPLPQRRVFEEGVLRFGGQAAELTLAGQRPLALRACASPAPETMAAVAAFAAAG